MAETKVTKNELKLDDIYPVGSIYISAVSTNPSTYFGGTWVAFATGRTLVGIDAGQTEFDLVEETGGAKTHTLTIAEMPSHSHGPGNAYNLSDGATTGAANMLRLNATANQNLAVANEGGSGAHNNLQPYIVVYMFKRTA